MKQFIFILGLMATVSAWAEGPVVSGVSCSMLVNGASRPVINIERVTKQGETSFEVTYFFKALKNNLVCKASEGDMPATINCSNSDSSDPSIEVYIGSADGVLNIGNLDMDGKSSKIYCSVSLAN